MTLQPEHLGLYYNQNLIALFHTQRDSELIHNTINHLTSLTLDTALENAHLSALRYRFLDDLEAGQHAIDLIKQVDWSDIRPTYIENVQRTLAWLHIFEVVRQHPGLNNLHMRWLENFLEQYNRLTSLPDDTHLVDELWLNALNIATSIAFEDDELFENTVIVYQSYIDNHIHPEGFLKGVVDVEETTDTFLSQVLGTSALVLTAEMGTRAGVDLWSLNNRGITPVTASTYIMYYYYYPEKWKWEENLTAERVESVVQLEGAFIEMVHHHSPMRGIDPLLEEQRPVFGVYSGGLTTLTHGVSAPSRKKRFRLFG